MYMNEKDFFKSILLNNSKITIGVIVFSLLSLLFQLPMPLITKYVFDNIIIPRKPALLKYVVLAFGIYLLGRISSVYLKNRFLIAFRTTTSKQIRELLYKHILFADLRGLNKYQSGYLSERIHRDSEEIGNFLGDTVSGIFENILIFISGVIITWYLSPKLAMLSYSLLPFYALSIKLWSKQMYKKHSVFKENRSFAHNKANLDLRHVVFLKSFANYSVLIKEYMRISKKLFDSEKKSLHVSLLATLTVQTIAFLAPVMVIVYGAYETIKSDLTVGGLVAFNAYLSYLFNPIKNFVNINLVYQRGKSSVDKIVEILSLPGERCEICKDTARLYKPASITFDKVSFRYDEKRWILKDFSFYVPEGGMGLIEGISGIGKSTLFLLIMRLYEVTEGRILISNKDIRTIPLPLLRKGIGYVPQNPVIFPETIYDNFKIGNPEVNDNEIALALDIACCDFIKKLKNGIYTRTSELVKNFSGGELTRINIAMAIVKRPTILLLDEVTSQIDKSTRECLIKNILSYAKEYKVTTLWITHSNTKEISVIGRSYGVEEVFISLS